MEGVCAMYCILMFHLTSRLCQQKVRLDGVVFPHLAQKVNSATNATARLKDKMINGELKMSTLQKSLMRARADQVDPVAELRRRQKKEKTASEEQQGGDGVAPVKKKAPKKMSQSVRDSAIECGLQPTAPLSNR